MFSVSSLSHSLGDVSIDVSVWNQELQIHSVHRQTACSVNHVLNTTCRRLVGKKNSEADSLSCHNSQSHSVIGLPHSTSSWVDWTSAAPQLSSCVCVGGALGSITHFMLSVSATRCSADGTTEEERISLLKLSCVTSQRDRRWFSDSTHFLLVFVERTMKTSRPHRPRVLCDAVNTCDLSDPSSERQSYVTVCHKFEPIRCGYWFYSTSLKACWCGGQWEVQPPSEKLPRS